MDRIKSRLFGSLVLVIMFSFITGIAYSQSDTTKDKMYSKKKTTTEQMTKYDRNVREAAQNLKSKVELTSDQTKKIEGILQGYKENSMKKNNSTVNNMSSSSDQTMSQIDNVLTSTQKTKFDKIKTDWWSTTEKSLIKTSTMVKKPSSSGY